MGTLLVKVPASGHSTGIWQIISVNENASPNPNGLLKLRVDDSGGFGAGSGAGPADAPWARHVAKGTPGAAPLSLKDRTQRWRRALWMTTHGFIEFNPFVIFDSALVLQPSFDDPTRGKIGMKGPILAMTWMGGSDSINPQIIAPHAQWNDDWNYYTPNPDFYDDIWRPGTYLDQIPNPTYKNIYLNTDWGAVSSAESRHFDQDFDEYSVSPRPDLTQSNFPAYYQRTRSVCHILIDTEFIRNNSFNYKLRPHGNIAGIKVTFEVTGGVRTPRNSNYLYDDTWRPHFYIGDTTGSSVYTLATLPPWSIHHNELWGNNGVRNYVKSPWVAGIGGSYAPQDLFEMAGDTVADVAPDGIFDPGQGDPRSAYREFWRPWQTDTIELYLDQETYFENNYLSYVVYTDPVDGHDPGVNYPDYNIGQYAAVVGVRRCAVTELLYTDPYA